MKTRFTALALFFVLTLCLAGCGGKEAPAAGQQVPADPTPAQAGTPQPVPGGEPTADTAPAPVSDPTVTPDATPELTPAPTPDPTPTSTPAPTVTPAATPEPTPAPTPDPTPTLTPTPAPKAARYTVTVNGQTIGGTAFESDERIWVPVDETMAALRYDWSYDAREEFPLKMVTPKTTYSMSPPSVKEQDGTLYFYAYMLTIFMDTAAADLTADKTTYAITCDAGSFTGTPKGIVSAGSSSGNGTGGDSGSNAGPGGNSGSGVVTCSTCGGSGRVFCVSCAGMGQKSSTTMQWNPVTNLYENRTTYAACTACGGSGRSICTACGGSGRRN